MSRVPELTLHSLNVRAVNVPLSPCIETAGGTINSAPLVLIDLLTNEGVTGRSYLFCYTPLALTPLAHLVANLEPVLKGSAVAPLSMERTLQQRFRLLGAQGLTGMAMAGIDMAAWDALAKAANLPLVTVLGGEPRPVPAYCSLRAMKTETVVAEAQAAVEAGFRAVKFRIGHTEANTDVTVARAVRQGIGEGMQIMVDYNQCLAVPEAARRARKLEEFGLTWIEEPTRAEDFAGHAQIRQEAATPIQIGENWWGTADMAKSLAAGASDYVMLDVMKIGGVSEWLRASSQAEAAGLPVSSHLFIELSAHLLAVTPTADWMEYLDLAGPILSRPMKVENGFVVAGSEPGTGVEWNEEAVGRYLVT